MDRGAWWATVHGVTKSRTRLSDRRLTPLSLPVCSRTVTDAHTQQPSPAGASPGNLLTVPLSSSATAQRAVTPTYTPAGPRTALRPPTRPRGGIHTHQASAVVFPSLGCMLNNSVVSDALRAHEL